MSRSLPTIAVVGATGLVGSEMTTMLDERKVPVGKIRLLASANSVGELYSFRGEEVEVEELKEDSFVGVDYALFGTSAELSKRFVPCATKAGAISIDNSSHFRMHDGIPLVVPEVNAHLLTSRPPVIANPNCSTIQLMPILKVIHELAGLKRVVVSTYQSVSGAGKAALDELWSQTLAIYNQKSVECDTFQHQIAFNCIPHIDTILEDGYTKEEKKIINESRKILGLPDLKITATAVRVPVFYSHAESVNVETERALTPKDLVEALKTTSGVSLYQAIDEYPLQINVAGDDNIHVARIRADESLQFGLNFWVVADNVRKGAALNAVQILEFLLKEEGN